MLGAGEPSTRLDVGRAGELLARIGGAPADWPSQLVGAAEGRRFDCSACASEPEEESTTRVAFLRMRSLNSSSVMSLLCLTPLTRFFPRLRTSGFVRSKIKDSLLLVCIVFAPLLHVQVVKAILNLL